MMSTEQQPRHDFVDAEKQQHQNGSYERCPIEEVALVVPETDDTTLPVMTFRAWFLGIVSCILLIFLNTFFSYRTQPLIISAILMQILALPLGRFLARILPTRDYAVAGIKFSFNPGPFNIKEHVIITIFANCGVGIGGGGDALSTGAITVMKAFYRQNLSFVCGLLIVLTTQVNRQNQLSLRAINCPDGSDRCLKSSRYWDMDGLGCLGSSSSTLLRCGGLPMLLRFLSSGNFDQLPQGRDSSRNRLFKLARSVCVAGLSTKGTTN